MRLNFDGDFIGRLKPEGKTLAAGCLAVALCLMTACPFSFAQGNNAPSSGDTTSGAVPGDAPSGFRRGARLMHGDMQGADSGDMNAEMMRRDRMRKAIMRARQMEDGGPPDGQEPFNRGQMDSSAGDGLGGGMARKRRFMQDGQPGGRRGIGGQFGGRGGFGGPKRALDLTALNLTEEQKNKIQQMRTRTSMRAKEVRRKLMTGGQELRDMMFDPSASDEMIRAKGRELRKLHEEAESMKLDDFLSIRGVLTAEQRKHLPEVKPGGPRAAMIGDGPGNRGDMPPPPDGGPPNN